MLRLDDLLVRTAELNRTAAAIDRSAWMTTGPTRTEQSRERGASLRALIARVTRTSSPASAAAPSTLHPA